MRPHFWMPTVNEHDIDWDRYDLSSFIIFVFGYKYLLHINPCHLYVQQGKQKRISWIKSFQSNKDTFKEPLKNTTSREVVLILKAIMQKPLKDRRMPSSQLSINVNVNSRTQDSNLLTPLLIAVQSAAGTLLIWRQHKGDSSKYSLWKFRKKLPALLSEWN